MKKILSLLIVLVVAIFLVGCEESKKDEKKKEEKMDYLVLVNKQNKLPDNWEKIVELEEDKDAWGDKVLVEKQALKKYKELKKDLEKEKVYIELDSIYRSVKEQQNLWDEWSKDPEKGPEYVKKYVAVPGYSEHHTGLAIDICIKKNGKIIADNDKMIAEKEIFAKIHKKLADYGFILRYPKGRDGVTGYAYEPWHLRYVGLDAAKKIAKEDITLEEYLGKETLEYNLEEDAIKVVCTKKENIDDVKVTTETTYTFNKKQNATGLMLKTSFVYADKDQYEYNVKDMKTSFKENYDDKIIQDFITNEKKKQIDTLLVYRDFKVSKKDAKKDTAKAIVKNYEENDNKCEIDGATRKDIGLK